MLQFYGSGDLRTLVAGVPRSRGGLVLRGPRQGRRLLCHRLIPGSDRRLDGGCAPVKGTEVGNHSADEGKPFVTIISEVVYALPVCENAKANNCGKAYPTLGLRKLTKASEIACSGHHASDSGLSMNPCVRTSLTAAFLPKRSRCCQSDPAGV